MRYGTLFNDDTAPTYKFSRVLQIVINRESKRNAFTPMTIQELSICLADARDDPKIGVIILTGAGDLAFCSGGDQSVRGKGGYVGADGLARLNVLDLQIQIRRLPKPVIAMVAGYAVGGGNILQMVCDITVCFSMHWDSVVASANSNNFLLQTVDCGG